MDLQKIYNDNDFEYAVVPEGQILVFNSIEDGKVVTRYKDSSGNFGTLSGGGGGGGGADVTLGQIDADGNFQPLAFNGTEASNDGSPETVENYYGWNGVLPSPSGGIKVIQGGDAVYYKCASVNTANKTWSGYLAVLGDDGVYTFEETVTTGLVYGTGYTPVPGCVYDATGASMLSLNTNLSFDSLVFYLPLDYQRTNAITGQALQYYGNVTHTSYMFRNCISLTGDSSNYISFSDETFPEGNSPRSISLRFNKAGSANDCVLFNHGAESTRTRFGVFVYDDKIVLGYGSESSQFTYTVANDIWYHVVFTFDGTNLSLYVNNKLIETRNIGALSTIREIGYIAHRNGDPFIGYLSDVRLYSKVLSTDEIQSLYLR